MASTLLITVANFETTITTALTPSSTSLTLTSNVDLDGTTLPDGVIGLTINEGKTNEEHVIGTKLGTVVSSLIRNVSRIDGTTAQSGKLHRKGSPIKITNHPLLVRVRRVLDGTDGFDGSNPMFYDSNPTWTPGSNQLATVKYIDDKAIAGSPDINTTTKGIAEEATQAEIDADTATGGTGARLVVNPSTLATSKYGTRLPSADQKAALAGTAGTPSSSNKYVTNDDTAVANAPSKVVRRTASGDIDVPATPSGNGDATSKGYVDTAVLKKISAILTDVSVTGTTSETNLLSVSIPAGTLGTANILRVTMAISDLDLVNSQSVTLKLKYGSTTIATLVVSNNATGGTVSNLKGLLTAYIYANGATAQEGSIAVSLGSGEMVISSNPATNLNGLAVGTAAENSAGVLNLIISATQGSTSNSITMAHALIEKIT